VAVFPLASSEEAGRHSLADRHILPTFLYYIHLVLEAVADWGGHSHRLVVVVEVSRLILGQRGLAWRGVYLG
jgi:hypothetical protein